MAGVNFLSGKSCLSVGKLQFLHRPSFLMRAGGSRIPCHACWEADSQPTPPRMAITAAWCGPHDECGCYLVRVHSNGMVATNPATPDPATPDPATPDPATPDPATPDPAMPDPAMPDPAMPSSAMPGSAMPGSVMPPAVAVGAVLIRPQGASPPARARESAIRLRWF
jgi:hypothetical protein